MLGARKRTDSEAVRLLTLASVGFSIFDTTAVLLPLLELVADVREPWPNIFGAGLVLLVLTSILPPILRKMQPAAPPGASTGTWTAGPPSWPPR